MIRGLGWTGHAATWFGRSPRFQTCIWKIYALMPAPRALPHVRSGRNKRPRKLCIEHGIDFPYVHDLAQLITLLQEEGQTVPDDVKEAGRLTRYAVFTRYPGLEDPVTKEDHERAVEIAERVVAWVEDHLESGGDASKSRSN